MEMETRARIHRPRPSRKLAPFGSEIWSAHQFGRECQSSRDHREAHFTTGGPASIELLSAQSLASSHGGTCSLHTRRRSSTYRLSCVRELISITRVHTRSTRDPPPVVGRLRVVVRQLVPVLRHRQHPYGAERGNHRDIHDNPH